ncbi:MAG: hypothetical protein WCD35_19225 [Mycobacteriales bacterium]
MTAPEDRYAEAEAAEELRRRAKARRQAWILIALIDALVVAVALTASVDLRRLQTPGGTALRWVQAAVFGECDPYLTYSVPDQPEERSRDQLCRDLRAATQQARAESARIGLRLGPVVRNAQGAQAQVLLTRRDVTSRLSLHLVRRGGHWRVLRDAYTCQSVGCA